MGVQRPVLLVLWVSVTPLPSKLDFDIATQEYACAMSTPTRQGLRFTSIRLENWRNFQHVDVDLERRVILVGPNAAGKSNFLDVFRFLRELVSGGGLQEATRNRGGVSALRSLAARRNPEVVIAVGIGSDDNADAWRYELSLGQDNNRRPLIKKETVFRDGNELFSRPNKKDEADPELLTQTFLEQVSANRDFRVVAEFFASVRYLHIVPQLVREPDRAVDRNDDPYGGDFLEQIARTPERTRTARLRKINSALSVAVPQLKELELWRDVRGTPHLRGKYEHWRPQGGWQTEERFSDGTLRLVGLLWAVLQGSGPLLLEEPELSLHPEVVRYLPQMFYRIERRTGRQIMLSTHSSDLLQDGGIGLNEVLILEPKSEGTSVRPASDLEEAHDLLAGGLTLADVLLPRTRPAEAGQIALFGS